MLDAKSGIKSGISHAGTRNLKPAKPGEVRNPKGINGTTKVQEKFKAVGWKVMNGKIRTTQGDMTGWEALWTAMRNEAIKGDVQCATWIRDTLVGKPAQTLDLIGNVNMSMTFADFVKQVRSET